MTRVRGNARGQFAHRAESSAQHEQGKTPHHEAQELVNVNEPVVVLLEVVQVLRGVSQPRQREPASSTRLCS